MINNDNTISLMDTDHWCGPEEKDLVAEAKINLSTGAVLGTKQTEGLRFNSGRDWLDNLYHLKTNIPLITGNLYPIFNIENPVTIQLEEYTGR